MNKHFLTILVLSTDSSKTKQYKIPLRVYKRIRNLLIVLVLAFAYLLTDYANMRVKALELSRLRKENVAQKIELNEFSKKINEVERQMAKLGVFDKKLRVLANIEDPVASAMPGSDFGVGGSTEPEPAAVSPAETSKALVEQMRADISKLESAATVQETRFVELEKKLGEQASLLASTPSIWPAKGWLTSGYGNRRSPFTGLLEHHEGLDIANSAGTEVIASADGVVAFAGTKSAYGMAVVINHGYGYQTTYGHLGAALVREGQRVKRGQKIGEMGNSGRSTGPHLHYNVALNGLSVNPMSYILN